MIVPFTLREKVFKRVDSPRASCNADRLGLAVIVTSRFCRPLSLIICFVNEGHELLYADKAASGTIIIAARFTISLLANVGGVVPFIYIVSTPSNALVPMLFTLFGIVAVRSLFAILQIYAGICSTLSPKVITAR